MCHLLNPIKLDLYIAFA